MEWGCLSPSQELLNMLVSFSDKSWRKQKSWRALWNCMEMCLQGKGVINLSFLATQKAVTQILPYYYCSLDSQRISMKLQLHTKQKPSVKHRLSNKLRLINWKAEIHRRQGFLKQQCSVLSAYWNFQSNCNFCMRKAGEKRGAWRTDIENRGWK